MWTLPNSATAADRPMVARLPRFRYRNVGSARPASRANQLGDEPPLLNCDGRNAGQRPTALVREVRHIAQYEMFGCPGRDKSGSTTTRPPRSTAAPVASANFFASGDAETPAAHTTVFVGSCSCSRQNSPAHDRRLRSPPLSWFVLERPIVPANFELSPIGLPDMRPGFDRRLRQERSARRKDRCAGTHA